MVAVVRLVGDPSGFVRRPCCVKAMRLRVWSAVHTSPVHHGINANLLERRKQVSSTDIAATPCEANSGEGSVFEAFDFFVGCVGVCCESNAITFR